MDVGQQLSEARQRRNLTLADISRTTKIPVHLLAAIERNDEAHLPQQFFRRAFVRAYAKEVGVNADDLLDGEDMSDTDPIASDILRANAVVEESASPRSFFFVALVAACTIYYGYTLEQTPGSAPTSVAAAAMHADEIVSVNNRGDITLPAADAAAVEAIMPPPAPQYVRHNPIDVGHDSIDASADGLTDSSSEAEPVADLAATEPAAAAPLSVEPSPVVSDAVVPQPDLTTAPAPVEQF